MKHLKMFEVVDEDTHRWKVDDYILVSLEIISQPEKYDLPLTKTTFGQIIECYEEEFPYKITLSNGIDLYFQDDEIIRYLTPREIEQFKMGLEVRKYNL